MTVLATVLNGSSTITTTTAPSLGTINSYSAVSGALAITLPAVSGLNVGATAIVEKNIADTTLNAVTFTATSGDTFDDSSTVLVINQPGEKRVLQVVQTGGATKYWKVVGGLEPKTGLTATTAQYALTNSATAGTIVTYTVPAATLGAGSTFRVTLNGTIQTTSTSGTLTFTPYIQNTALAQTAVMATQTSANAAAAFSLEYTFTVRSAGASGTAIAKPFGIIGFATPVYLSSTSTTATTVNTTSSASNTSLYVTATWATANAANSLLVETATIERVI